MTDLPSVRITIKLLTIMVLTYGFGCAHAEDPASQVANEAVDEALTLGGVGGGFGGTLLAKRLSGGGKPKMMFVALIFVVAFYMLWQSWQNI